MKLRRQTALNHSKLLFLLLLVSMLIVLNPLQAQVARVVPAKPGMNTRITIIFDATKGNAALKDAEGPVYFHAGLITTASRDEKDWKFVVGDWGKADPRVKMTAAGDNLFTASFVPAEFSPFRLM